MNTNPFLKRLIKEKNEDVIHSSAYAKVQNDGNMGVASTRSFAERQAIGENRTMVKGYRDSKVVNDAFSNAGSKSQRYDVAHDASRRAAIWERFGGEQNRGGAGTGFGGGASNTNTRGSGMGGRNGVGGIGGAMPMGRTTEPPARRNPGIL